MNDGAEVSLWSRQGKNLTRYFPELAGAELPDGTVLDGEAVIWNEGRLDFTAMQNRLTGGAVVAARRCSRSSPLTAAPEFRAPYSPLVGAAPEQAHPRWVARPIDRAVHPRRDSAG